MNRVLFFSLFASFVTILNAQSELTISTKALKDSAITVNFRCLFKTTIQKDYDDYCIIDATSIDSITIDPSLVFIFGNQVDDLKKYIFTLIICKKHDRNTYEKIKNDHYSVLSVQTSLDMWHNYECFMYYDQKVQLLCGCKLSIPIPFIKTQLIVCKE